MFLLTLQTGIFITYPGYTHGMFSHRQYQCHLPQLDINTAGYQYHFCSSSTTISCLSVYLVKLCVCCNITLPLWILLIYFPNLNCNTFLCEALAISLSNSESSSKPACTPRHTHLSLTHHLAFFVVLDLFSVNFDTEIG